MKFIYIDLKDDTGGFMIPDDGEVEDVIAELLKDPKYVRRKPGNGNAMKENDMTLGQCEQAVLGYCKNPLKRCEGCVLVTVVLRLLELLSESRTDALGSAEGYRRKE